MQSVFCSILLYPILFRNTLPSSSTSGWTSDYALYMHNGQYAAGTASSYGSYYNPRIANTLTASETVVAKDYTYNICPKNWTLPTHTQHLAIVNNYSSSWNRVYPGYYGQNKLYPNGSGYWWPRTARSSAVFYTLWAASSNGSIGTSDDEHRYGENIRCLQK